MFGVLVSTEVGHDAAGAVLRFDSTSDLTNHGDHLVEQGLVSVAEIYQGRNVLLRYDDDVNWPVRSGVLERQNLIRLGDHLDRRPTTQRLVAVEVLAHRPIPLLAGPCPGDSTEAGHHCTRRGRRAQMSTPFLVMSKGTGSCSALASGSATPKATR
jgi:hypothetical protein